MDAAGADRRCIGRRSAAATSSRSSSSVLCNVPKISPAEQNRQDPKQDLLPQIERYSKLASFEEIIPISALTGENLEQVLVSLFKYLPEGPPYYPDEQLSDRPERSIAGEMVREKVINLTRDELPYSTAVIVERVEEGERLVRVFASICVERETQKGIVIGKGGQLLKEIGTAARLDLEKLFARAVYLELRVKVMEGWRDDESALKGFGLGGPSYNTGAGGLLSQQDARAGVVWSIRFLQDLVRRLI